MSLKQIRKQNKKYNVSIIDMLRKIDPSKTGKYMPLLIKELRNYDERSVGFNYTVFDETSYNTESHLEFLLADFLLDSLGGKEVIKNLVKFEDYLSKGHIEKNDIQEYKSLNELGFVVDIVDRRLSGKSLKPKQDIVFSDDDWLILKPLNLLSSRKYGAGTKWCTTHSEESYFYDYSERGVLLYIMERGTDVKWAALYEKDGGGRVLSWWNVVDVRVDGMMVDLPPHIKEFVVDYVVNEKHNNSHYFDDETKGERDASPKKCSIIMDEDFGEDDIEMVDDVVEVDEELPITWVDEIINGGGTTDYTTTLTNCDGYSETSTTTTFDVDELVRKTLEYRYRIDALEKGGKNIESIDEE